MIAAVLAIAAMVVVVLTGILEGGESRVLVTEAQDDASNCYSTIAVNTGYHSGQNADLEDNEDVCGGICQGDWVNETGVGVISGQNASGEEVTTAREACLAGRPEWIVQIEE